MSDQEILTVHLNRTKCAGHALCAHYGPDVYQLDETGYCATDGVDVPPEFARQAKLGARACPERAITLTTRSADA